MEVVRFIEEETKARYQISTYATKIRADNDKNSKALQG